MLNVGKFSHGTYLSESGRKVVVGDIFSGGYGFEITNINAISIHFINCVFLKL